MAFQYYWDNGLSSSHHIDTEGLLDMGNPANLQKLVQRVQRGNGLLDKATGHSDKADAVMNNFEQTLGRFEAHFGTIEEHDKQLSAILTEMGGNGGPALSDMFQSSSAVASTATPVTGPIEPSTGDPKKL